MIKHDGVDIPRIEYIDPVDGEVNILRVMLDGVQIWPDGTPPVKPNTPTGIQLSEYEIVDTLEIPTGITLIEVMNIPTGITLREVIQATIEWDYFITYTVTTNTEVRAYLKDDVILPFTGGDETQFELKVNGSPVVFINFGIHYSPGASYVTLRNPTDFLPTDTIEFSYTAGADPIEGENTGTFAPDLVDQLVENTVEAHNRTADNPIDIPALFRQYRDQGQPWVQPIDQYDAYYLGDWVTHNGKDWKTIIETPNVWEPGAVGSENLWNEIIDEI